MRLVFQLIVIILLLVSCSSITSKKLVPIFTTKSIKSSIVDQQVIAVDIVPQFPKVKTPNWAKAITPLINQLKQTSDVEFGKILLVDSIKNNTNMLIQLTPLVNVIIDAVNNQNIFKLVPQDIIASARRALGLLQEDSLVTRSKVIGLARYLQADYVLYSIISGSKQQNRIEIQLIEAKTGEILWSGINHIE